MTIEHEIIAADEARIAALLARDSTALDALLADDVVYVHSSGVEERKAEYLARVASAHYDYRAFVIKRRDFRHINDLVFVNGDNDLDIVLDGTLRHLSGRYLMVWRKDAGRWRLVTFHSASVPRKA